MDSLRAGRINTAGRCADYSTYILKRLCHNLVHEKQITDCFVPEYLMFAILQML